MITYIKKMMLLGVLGGVLGGFLFQSSVALAINIPGALIGTQNVIQKGESVTGIRLDTVLAAAGLKSGKFRDCTASGVLGALAGFLKNLKNQIQQLAQEYLNTFFQTVARSLIYCALSNLQKTINPSFLGTTLGGLIIRTTPQCTIDIGGAMSSTFTNVANQAIQREFIANCVSRIMAERIKNDARQQLQTAGPFGSGPAWVQSWYSIPQIAESRARARFWNELVNTNICSYMKNEIFAYFRVPQAYINNPAPMAGISLDSGDPFPTRAACTLPAGFIPGNTTDPGSYLAMVTLLSEQQNNPQGFIDMANVELANQTTTMVTAAQNEAVAGGGVLSISDCMTYSPDKQDCMVPGPNKQVPATLQISLQAATNAATSNYQQDAVNDIEAQFANDIINLANAPLPINIELGPQYNSKNYSTNPEPVTPAVPGDGSSNDPVCIGDNVGCTCMKNDAATQQALVPLVAQAMKALMDEDGNLGSPFGFNNLFSPPHSSKIAPGVSYQSVGQGICAELDKATGANLQCSVDSTSPDQIVIGNGGLTFTVNVITSDGFLRTNGGQVILSCPASTQ